MQAWQYSKIRGTLEASLTLSETVAAPDASTLTRDQLLVEVITAALNPVDFKMPESGFLGKLFVVTPASPSRDFCGRVVAKHASNTTEAEGALVFGTLAKPQRLGTLSQRIVVSRHECAPLPSGVSPDDAAGVGLAAMTALQAFQPLHLKADPRVFIGGGSGGVGTFAIQFAKVLGATVTVSCSAVNAPLCRSLGADTVINYTTTNVLDALKKDGRVYDLAIDAAGVPPDLYEHSHAFLKPTGTFVQVAANLSLSSLWTVAKRLVWPTVLGGGHSRFHFISYRSRHDDFTRIGQWMTEGRVHVVVDSVYEWADVPAAFAKLRTGHAKGKILVHVRH